MDASSVLYLLCSCSDQHGRKKEEYLVYMDMVVPDGSLSTVSRRRQPGERNCTRNFVLCFCLIFFRASKWGDRASSRGLVLRLGLRHRRSDPIVITDRSSSLCVHGPPGSIRWAGLVCGASPPRRRIVGAAATRLPRTIHRCGGGPKPPRNSYCGRGEGIDWNVSRRHRRAGLFGAGVGAGVGADWLVFCS